MDTIKSFKGYGKVDPQEEEAFRRKTRKRLVILSVSAVVLVLIIVGAVTGTVIHKGNNDGSTTPSSQMTPAQSLKAICSQTQYPDSCYSSISQLERANATIDPEELFKLSLRVVMDSLNELYSMPGNLMNGADNQTVSALGVCQAMFDSSIERLNDSISSMEAVKPGERLLSSAKINDLRTWLSATITDQETCLDALRESNSMLLEEVTVLMRNSTEYASNSLAIVSKISEILGELNLPIHRKLLGMRDEGFPEWVSAGDRRFLQEVVVKPTPNVTVAKDGSGDVTTLKEAVAKIPKKSLNRFVIYVKEGVYVENVAVGKSYSNVMIYGDGMTKTIISGNLSFTPTTSTYFTATFAVDGSGFMAVDMGFRNTAGAIKQQAVAVRSGSDKSVFYRCSFDAFQDTLYAYSNRQFYRECNIIGTIDFIFGNAASVFQNCNILPRQPLANQFVTITAQGKTDPNQNTGISIQGCNLSPLDNLTAHTYLGRPWKDYATTVIMQSAIGGFLDPTGWAEWSFGVVPPSTIFYAEYQNTGPGASVAQRVKWAGYKPSITPAQASAFSVKSFIEGEKWLPQTNVQYQSSL